MRQFSRTVVAWRSVNLLIFTKVLTRDIMYVSIFPAVSTNSKICRGPNTFGVVHSKSGKDRRNFGQKMKNSPGNRRFTRFTGIAFSQPVERKRFFIKRDYAFPGNSGCAVRRPAASF
jgi:hypothetical protein